MKTFELTGTPRSEYGKKAAKAFRKENLVPCNLYGNGENVTFVVTVDDVRKLIYTPDTMAVALTIGDAKKMAVVKELQFHPVTEELFHIDFLEVTEQRPVTVAIPVQLVGHAEGVRGGGKLSLEMRKLKVTEEFKAYSEEEAIQALSDLRTNQNKEGYTLGANGYKYKTKKAKGS